MTTLTDRHLQALREAAVGRYPWELLAERIDLEAAGLLEGCGPGYVLTPAGRRAISRTFPAENELAVAPPPRTPAGETVNPSTPEPILRLTFDRWTLHAILAGDCTHVLRQGTPPQARRANAHRQGRGEPAVCRLQIIETAQATVGALMRDGDTAAAIRLGAPTVAEARRRYLTVHDRRTSRRPADEIAAMTADQINHAFERHRDRPCTLLTVQVLEDHSLRFLARTGSATGHKLVDRNGERRHLSASDDHSRGYTTIPALELSGAGEAVDDITLARYAAQAQDRDAARRRAELYKARQQVRAALEGRADPDLFVIEQRLDKAARKLAG